MTMFKCRETKDAEQGFLGQQVNLITFEISFRWGNRYKSRPEESLLGSRF